MGAKNHWRSTTLGETGKWLSGGTPSKSKKDYWVGEIPWVSPKDMKVLRIEDSIDHVSSASIDNGTKLAPKGALLVVVRGMILAHTFPVALTVRPVTFNQDIKALIPGPHTFPDYLLYWLQHKAPRVLAIVNEATHGTKRVPTEALHRLPLELPPLAEQRKIAAILSSVDEAIEKTQAVIDQVQVVKRGLMQELLTRGLPGRHTRFKQTPIGEIPEEWEVKNFGHLIADGPTNGIYKASKYIGKGNLLVGMSAIEAASVDWARTRRVQLEDKERERFGLRAGDLLIRRVYAVLTRVGRAALVPPPSEPAVYESNMMRVRLDTKKAHPAFYQMFFDLPQVRRQVEARATLGAQASINNKTIRDITVLVPQLSEQLSISLRLDAVEKYIYLERKTLKGLEAVKQSLMAVLLTGEVRVRTDEEKTA